MHSQQDMLRFIEKCTNINHRAELLTADNAPHGTVLRNWQEVHGASDNSLVPAAGEPVDAHGRLVDGDKSGFFGRLSRLFQKPKEQPPDDLGSSLQPIECDRQHADDAVLAIKQKVVLTYACMCRRSMHTRITNDAQARHYADLCSMACAWPVSAPWHGLWQGITLAELWEVVARQRVLLEQMHEAERQHCIEVGPMGVWHGQWPRGKADGR